LDLLTNFLVDVVDGDGLDVVFWFVVVDGSASVEGFDGGDAVTPGVGEQSDRIGAAEYHNQWSTQCCGNMAGAGIITYHELCGIE